MIKILTQGGGKCTGACLNNTRLVLLGGDHLMTILVLALDQAGSLKGKCALGPFL
jgi:hypothetical protein